MGGVDDTPAEARPHAAGRNLAPINLAAQAPVRLGALVVRPALRQVVHDDGREQIIQPRVMQVLVALLRADGEILTRDDLVASCWRGIVVGEDAITRVIGSLRRLSEGVGADVFKLETITRVGYRLVHTDVTDDVAPTAGPLDAERPAPLLAVLAFDNLCEGDDMAWFSDGVSEEIQLTVARAADLRVVGRSSSFQFRGPDKAADRVAAALKATHVLDGSVRRSADKVRVSAQLIECAGQTTLWSDRFDRDLADIFALQDEIAAAVAAALKATFVAAAPAGRINPAAYDLFLKARSVSDTHVSRADQTKMLESAVQMEPRFAAAWAALAYVRAVQRRRISLDEQSLAVPRPAVVAAAEAALRLDRGAGLAYAALAQLSPWAAYEEREALLQKSLAAAPRAKRGMTEMGWFLNSVGRNNAALACATRASVLDPLDPGAANIAGQMLAAVGRYEEAQESYAASQAKWPLTPVFVYAPLMLAAIHQDQQRFDQLKRKADQQGLSTPHVVQAIVIGELALNHTPETRDAVLGLLEGQLASTGSVEFGPLHLAYSIGLADEAFSFVDRASYGHMADESGPSPAGAYSPGLIFDRTWDRPMMQDPRFVGLCVKIGLCDYWTTTGHWPDCADMVDYDFRAECRRLAH